MGFIGLQGWVLNRLLTCSAGGSAGAGRGGWDTNGMAVLYHRRGGAGGGVRGTVLVDGCTAVVEPGNAAHMQRDLELEAALCTQRRMLIYAEGGCSWDAKL